MVGAATLLTALAALSPVAVASPRKRAAPQKITLEYRVKDAGPDPKKFAVSSDASIENLDGFKWNQNYALKFWAGTPRQQVTMLVDTGSADIVLWGQGCDNCRVDDVFKWQESSTYSTDNKIVSVSYSGGSNISGPNATDTFTIGSFTQNASFINVQNLDYQTSQDFPAGEMGIIGLGYPWSYGTGTSWAQVAALNLWPEPVFGVFLKQPDLKQQVTPNAGELVLGGVDDEKFAGRPYTQYPLVVEANQRWTIEMGGVRINGEGIPLPNHPRRTLIDTGSEISQVPLEICDGIKNKIPGSFYVNEGPRSTALYAPCNSTASVEFQFGNIWYPMAVRDLFYLPEVYETPPRNCRTSYVCRTIEGEIEWEYLMGANFLRNVYSSYSYEPKQVGLAPLADRRGEWDYGWNAGPPPTSSAPPVQSSTAPPAESSTSPATSAPVETTSPPVQTTTPPVDTTTPPAESSTSQAPPVVSSSSSSAGTTTPPTEPTTSPAPPAESSTSQAPPVVSSSSSSAGTTTPPTEPTTSPAPPVESSTSPAPPVQSSTSPAPPTEPTTSPAPPTESTASPAPPTEPTTSPAPPTEPTTSPAPPVEPTTSSAPPTEPNTSPAPPTEPTTSPAPPTEPTTSPAPPGETSSAAPPVSTGGPVDPVPPPTKPCPCHKGDIYWYWDGRRWRLVSRGWWWWWSGGNRYGRPKGHVWRWNRHGQFGVVAPNSDKLLKYSPQAEKVAEGSA